ncbi:type IV toxin-antitoxin system AbiEi family antitoxin domain-containing protein [Agromyces arachidis]|uniref:type IV toxin-antitoxin system AbiEi family antitoxin domain-containing protein n=1 Tax=Agromyces arachidis TaxID=766966 RepID=UPI0040566766
MTDPLPSTEHGLVLARDLRAAGRDAELYAAVRAGSLERVRRGAYRVPDPSESSMPASKVAALRYRASVHAAAEALHRPTFTGHSAAALAGLPIVGPWPSHVVVLSRDGLGSRRPGVVSVGRPAELDVGATDGCATTAIEFTLIQLAKQAPLAAALVATDAALHVPRGAQAGAPLTTLDALRAEHERLGRYPGCRRVDAVLARAVTDAESPLETMSRLVIEEFGFPIPVLQHRVQLPDLGRHADLDFYWPRHDVAAEADGDGKYLGAGDVAATARSVIREKQREDAIRRAVRGFARWDWKDMWSREPLRARLVAAGLPVVRAPVRLITLR